MKLKIDWWKIPGQAEVSIGRAVFSVSEAWYLLTNSWQVSIKLKLRARFVSNT